MATLLKRGVAWLSLERDFFVMIFTILILTMGNQLWSRFVPVYLEYLGASTIIIGAYGSLKSVLNSIYQYPGGVISDKLGSKRALVLFTFLSIMGYLIYLASNDWMTFFFGTFFVLIWDNMSQPAVFSLIGEELRKSRRVMGFSIQSILKRIPIVIAPPLGGYLIEKFGLKDGMKIGFLISILLAFSAIYFQRRFYEKSRIFNKRLSDGLLEVWQGMASSLKRLLLSDIMARLASNMIKTYIVLYVINVLGASPLEYGLFISIQMTTSILSYLPAIKLSNIYGRKPLVAATFTFFSLFPFMMSIVTDKSLLFLSFMIAGLREIGEPARKSMIVDLSERSHKGRTIGLYYLIREAVMIPAPLVGGIVWMSSPRLLFITASVIGIFGILILLLSKFES
ncbi:MAG: MFS transporter [Candidatus Asgardarchaeia archaeon]